MAHVLVVGAVNADIVIGVDRRPTAGETVTGNGYVTLSGGKGANQAVAAAVAGARTRLVGAVGDDEQGRNQRAALTAFDVDTSAVVTLTDLPTGLAVVTVTPDAENAVVVALGANAAVTPALVDGALAGLAPGGTDVVVAQTEVGGPTADAAARHARRLGARFVVNAGPVVALAQDTLALADPLVVNQHEAADLMALLGTPGGATPSAAALRKATGARSVVVTLGGDGATVADEEADDVHVPAVPVTPVDTTGAGDTYVGTLAAALGDGARLTDAAAQAAGAAARAVTWSGARPPQM